MKDSISNAFKGIQKSFSRMFNGNKDIDNDLDNLYLIKSFSSEAVSGVFYEVVYKSKNIEKIKIKMMDLINEGNKANDLAVLNRVGLNINIDIEEIEEIEKIEENEFECPLDFDLNSFIKDRDEILKERNFYKEFHDNYRDSVDSGH